MGCSILIVVFYDEGVYICVLKYVVCGISGG